jgi:hypothetical protein
MRKKVSLVVLCEDEMHQSFINAFLKRIGLPLNGRPRIERLGSRSNVVEGFPKELRAIRRSHVNVRLLVVIDADGDADASIEAQFREKLREQNLADDISQDPLLLVIPRWELENWALDLMGRPIGEGRDRAARRKIGDDVREAGRRLADACKEHGIPGTPLPSLQKACTDWHSFRAQYPL